LSRRTIVSCILSFMVVRYGRDPSGGWLWLKIYYCLLLFFRQPDDGLHTGPKYVVVYYILLLNVILLCFMTVCIYRYIHTTALYYWPNITGMTHLNIKEKRVVDPFIPKHGTSDNDWGVYIWPWKLLALGKDDTHLFVSSYRSIQVKNALRWSAVVSCSRETFSAVFCVVWDVNKFDFRRFANETPNKPAEIRLYNDTESFFFSCFADRASQYNLSN